MSRNTTTLQIQGIPVHLTYTVLPNNLCLWDLDRAAYEGNLHLPREVATVFDLLEQILRQLYGDMIQRDLLEHSFYNEMMVDTASSGDDEDIPF